MELPKGVDLPIRFEQEKELERGRIRKLINTMFGKKKK